MPDKNHDPIDLEFSDHGSITIMRARSDAGRAWVDEHIDPDAVHALGGIVVEPRFVDSVIEGAQGDGLTVALG